MHAEGSYLGNGVAGGDIEGEVSLVGEPAVFVHGFQSTFLSIHNSYTLTMISNCIAILNNRSTVLTVWI